MKKTILVVDDEEHIRLLYKEEFEEEGYTVLLAGSGEDALTLVENKLPDLITLDIKMPGIDGITLARKIKEIRSDMPVIFVSAYEDYKHDFGTWASDAYFVKSANLAELKSLIAKILKDKASKP
ncbi:MAG: two-component system response regulator [Nitrospirae bacterium RIFCSPLOW2_12_42_9]|nr:MAG: two-component system response regulator [Nitrospirae bacterium RIFCSPLOWO2_02_42_7]OGW61665.1 MAG: two-component system response regulator [Nitrospirae bacterium RIFCSPLOW2_12_42_9]HAS17383.1 two-component system response regulator [Nitrospiraceae bacterium]HBI23383.1 two-component system response regulator [Nitrospiraceae bacterium]